MAHSVHPVGLNASTFSHVAWESVCGVPSVLAKCASQHIQHHRRWWHFVLQDHQGKDRLLGALEGPLCQIDPPKGNLEDACKGPI